MTRLILPIFLLLAGFVNLLIASDPPVLSYRLTVGPPITNAPLATRSADKTGRLIVVDWNVHVGHGDIQGLIDRISRSEMSKGFGKPEFILLLQESFRHSSDIPDSVGFKVPRRIAPPEEALDIQDVAQKLGWWMYYAPSMRNGNGSGKLAEDRGNAILSTLPLESVTAVELPFVVQRRVALIATVTDKQKQARLRVAVTHFDTRAPMLDGWIFGGPSARTRQAKEFVAALKNTAADSLPLIVGGDLNAYIGSKPVVDAMSEIAPHTNCGSEPTHALGSLDHVFASIPTAWPRQCVRGESTFGSDHFPLVLTLNVPW
jgi:endonuclease/exonuclease/phosphatase family metal-dependent hydrolase